MFFLNDVPKGLYSAPWEIPGGAVSDVVNLQEDGPQVIWDIYDRLVAQFPQYVTKQTIDPESTYPLHRYTFTPPEIENTSDFIVNRFKVCIVTAVHGREQACAWTAAHFFRLMCQNTQNPYLTYLRQNVVFDVVPVANPYGVAHNLRKNENGVDLNRNYDVEFIAGRAPEDSEYGGPFPCSETQTRALMQFIEENADAQVVLDYHNIGKGYPLFYVYKQEDAQLAFSLFTALTPKWQAEYPELPTDRILGRLKPNGHEGMFADYLLSKNMWVLTMETPFCMPVIGKEKFDSTTIRCSLDVLVNTLLTILRARG